jgi:hypothetical protein
VRAPSDVKVMVMVVVVVLVVIVVVLLLLVIVIIVVVLSPDLGPTTRHRAGLVIVPVRGRHGPVAWRVRT